MSLFGKKQTDTASVTYISYSGDTQQVAVPIGDSVMEGAISNGIDGIVAECGGACQCATCHVYVDAEWFVRLPAPMSDESDLLSGLAARRENSRLSCQITLSEELSGLKATMAPEE